VVGQASGWVETMVCISTEEPCAVLVRLDQECQPAGSAGAAAVVQVSRVQVIDAPARMAPVLPTASRSAWYPWGLTWVLKLVSNQSGLLRVQVVARQGDVRFRSLSRLTLHGGQAGELGHGARAYMTQ